MDVIKSKKYSHPAYTEDGLKRLKWRLKSALSCGELSAREMEFLKNIIKRANKKGTKFTLSNKEEVFMHKIFAKASHSYNLKKGGCFYFGAELAHNTYILLPLIVV